MKDFVQTKTTHDAILDATEKLLARYGYKKMTIDDLAHEVGIGKGTVYLYFPSKEEIALTHIDRIIERMKSCLWNIAKSDVSPASKIKKMLIERVMFRFDSVQHYSLSLNEMLAQIRPKLLQRRKRYFAEEASILAGVLAEGSAAGIFADDAEKYAEALVIATNSLLPYSLSTFELGSREEIKNKASSLADVLVAGVERR
ncbi:MAG TPA: TetR/AcrR family transcriptional regulator [Pyrinomonadaceae bacterium]|nr:TetR/AcrR family transcriptional regulator [Pyrinomonadaceae bacterium]